MVGLTTTTTTTPLVVSCMDVARSLSMYLSTIPFVLHVCFIVLKNCLFNVFIISLGVVGILFCFSELIFESLGLVRVLYLSVTLCLICSSYNLHDVFYFSGLCACLLEQ